MFTKKIFIIILSSLLYGSDIPKVKFENSIILPIPDLSFFENTYTGLDIIEQMDFEPFENKKIAILTNHTAVNRNGKHLLDLIHKANNSNVLFILAFENGLWGVDDKRSTLIGREGVEPLHEAPIIDLFDTYVYPPHWVMDEVDFLLVDFQDTGSRYATYIATMSKVFEAASNHKVPVILLDRPNPIRGDILEGPIPRAEYQSYESYHLLPIRHGLTYGEISIMINEMGWIDKSKKVDLTVVPMANWNRNQWFSETALVWKNPKPSIQNEETLLAYSGMDIFRGTNMNIGFGTETPYLIVGAPWLSTTFLLEKLRSKLFEGVEFSEISYRPHGSSYHKRVPKYDGQSCSGIKIFIKNKDTFEPLKVATSILFLINQLHPREFQWEANDYIDKLFGTNELRVMAAQKKPASHLTAIWSQDIYKFSEFRQKFLIYK